MSRFDTPDPVPVRIGDCECPGTPHPDGDFVYLAPVLSAPGGMAAQGAISDAGTDGVRLQELLWRVYRDHGVIDWNLTDEEGDKVALTAANKEAGLPYAKGGRLVADKADDLYAQDVLAPFVERIERLRRSSAGSTSRPKAGSSTPTTTKRRRSPSSTASTARARPRG